MPTPSFLSPSGRQLGLAACAGLGLSLIGAVPASAHSIAGAGLATGFSHPLLGLDHLLLLVGVGASASFISSTLLLYALAGAALGSLFGLSGGQLPLAELVAALAVSLLGLLILRSRRQAGAPPATLYGLVVMGSVAVHAMLHGHEASGANSWWLGAFLASTLVVGVSYGVLRKLGTVWTLRLAGLLSLAGGVLALAQIEALRAVGAG
ncbi:HupE/UreJ family protein [Synechococcus sp. CS-602]|uniref:HupE/UreJ family protein n=1 Tax=Synechococcaceae TaxID=1890426 RepID=UPI0008FF31D2|nr:MULTISPECIES: HupE/UreJ family protein [Synechococcaceae]MCT4363854.1 HupE/UreJ family protein [Candidatus Regnicoccus frigidus MAG-AL1]APD49047.1 hypothetical protein BM449_13360 [Synechococcus sp. SynAce01]MCT0201644.1 HupE/UreJ family protein [Synechococcus sp. CS-603]MCT0203511.1 HupE/UreJ family protein [Synechococcus sp. CS-602]MCT0246265.1 HupE/UreJ family protein [Synechococcus sp. CS-601]